MASQYRRRSLMLNTIAKVAQGNPTIITDSSSRRLQKLNIYGQSEQDSTTGAQLFDSSLFESNDITKNGIHFVKNSDGSISVIGTSTGFSTYNLGLNQLENGTYFINGSKNNAHVYIHIKKTNGASYIENNSFTIDGTETLITAYVQIKPDFTVNDIIYPMLNLGNTAKPFEPYTGGKPSPSPDYPQEIISKEVSEIKVTGKNLANIQEFEKVYDGYTFEAHYENDKIIYSNANDWNGCAIVLSQTFEAGQYSIQAKGVAMLISDIALPSFEYNKYWNGKGYPYIYRLTQSNTKVSFNSDMPFKIGFIGGDNNTGESTVSGTMEQVQIELGSVATSYEPYKEQVVNLTSPITLPGIPVDKGGNITIDGQQYIADYIDSLTGKVNRLNGYIDSYNGEEVGTIFMSTTGQLTTGAKVIYKLSQPTQEDLPQQDQEAIRALTTYYPNTVIQTGCWNEVTYSAKRGG